MRRIGRRRLALVVAARAVTFTCALMLLLGVHDAVTDPMPAAAADGPQAAPSLEPEAVATATDAFSLRPPAGARCEEDGSGSGADGDAGPRTGADNWRWHTFIVEAGRDLSTLEFGPFGPGDDYDAADGSITAGLIATGDGIWQRPPAQKPEGLINPNDLGSVVLDPGTYTFRDGEYELGFACTDATLATRQWWSLTVTIQTSGQPFLTVSSQDAGTVHAETPASTEAAAANVGATGTSLSPASDSTTTPDDAQVGTAPATVDDAAPGATLDETATSPTGVSWSPLVALGDASDVLPIGVWAVLLVVFARIAYLLAKPVHVLPVTAP